MRATARVLLALLFVIGLVRAVWYAVYVFERFAFPYDAQHLEAVMVHFAWRVQHGARLYPDWEHFPHVANFYAPLDFLIVGAIGGVLGTDIAGLFAIGRAVSVVSVLLTTLVLGLVLKRRYGAVAGGFGMVLSLGAAPLFGSGLMVRPDALAELLGLTGVFLAEGRRGATGAAAVVVLALAVMTKQTALVYPLAAVVGLALQGRTRRAFFLCAGGTLLLSATVLAVQWFVEPRFVRCLLGESRTPIDFASWWQCVRKAATLDPEFFILTAAGLAIWTRGPRTEPVLTALAVLLLAASLATAAKRGSAEHYFLGMRSVAALAAGALWRELAAPTSRPRAWQVLTVLAAVGGLALSTNAAYAYAAQARRDAWILRATTTGRDTLAFYKRLFRTAQDPKGRLLTDSGIIDIHQGAGTVFGDPYRFKLMVEAGQIDPRRLREMIADQYYDLIVCTKDLFAPAYDAYDFGLPAPLAERVRRHYEPAGALHGLFLYVRRAPSAAQ